MTEGDAWAYELERRRWGCYPHSRETWLETSYEEAAQVRAVVADALAQVTPECHRTTSTTGGSMFGLLWSKLRARRGWCAECGGPILGKRRSYRTCSRGCENAVRDALAQI